MSATSAPAARLPSRLPRARRERGFALLSVVFFVLALTILSMSLFSLSSFEARFFKPSVDHAEAVQAARGGVEWVRYVLQSTDSLDLVHDPAVARPPLVQYAVARQAPLGTDFADATDSTGSVFDTPHPVWIRVVATKGTQSHAVTARYQPSDGHRLYKRLITAMDSVLVEESTDPDPPHMPRYERLFMRGEVAIAGGSFRGYLGPLAPGLVPGYGNEWCLTNASAPEPAEDVEGEWWQQRFAEARILPVIPGNGFEIVDDPPGAPQILKPDPVRRDMDTGGRWWSCRLESEADCRISARGTSVLLFEEGLRCEKQLRIQNATPGETTTVILVSRPGPGPIASEERDVGFAFLGGVDADPGIKLFLVSSGGVEIEHWFDQLKGNGNVPYLSIYSDFVKLLAPWRQGNNGLYLSHGVSCAGGAPEDVRNGLVDRLIERNLLPNSRFARRKVTFVRDTWMEAAMVTGQ